MHHAACRPAATYWVPAKWAERSVSRRSLFLAKLDRNLGKSPLKPEASRSVLSVRPEFHCKRLMSSTSNLRISAVECQTVGRRPTRCASDVHGLAGRVARTNRSGLHGLHPVRPDHKGQPLRGTFGADSGRG